MLLLRLGGQLYKQYLVDAYVRAEQDRLDYLRTHQREIKAEDYKVLRDYVDEEDDPTGTRVGQSIILPSSYKGGPRHCNQAHQDAMAIVRKHGKPSLFVTFTCNPNWPEIRRNLLPGKRIWMYQIWLTEYLL